MSESIKSDELGAHNLSFALEVLELSYKASHARLLRLFQFMDSKEEKHNWGSQIVLLVDLMHSLEELKQKIYTRGQ